MKKMTESISGDRKESPCNRIDCRITHMWVNSDDFKLPGMVSILCRIAHMPKDLFA